MSHYIYNPDFYNNPVFLSEEQKRDPLQALRDFFADYNLCELRQINEDISEVCLTTDRPPFSEPEDRANHIAYSQHLIVALEAASLLTK